MSSTPPENPEEAVVSTDESIPQSRRSSHISIPIRSSEVEMLSVRNSEQKEQLSEQSEDTSILSTDKKPPSANDIVVKIENVHKTYLLGVEGIPALRGVSLTIKRGEFVVILGKSGGGKTSMLNVMGTIDKPTKGHVKVCDTVVSTKTKDADIAFLRLKRIGFCFQTFNLISSMSAVENVELPMVLAGEMNRTQIRKRAKELLQTVGLGERIYHRPSQMSGGEQQRVTLCRAVSNNPDLILLDEPTGDLDTMNSNIILKLLVELNVNQRITMVMVTHDISLKYLAHRVVHMLDGKIHKIERISAEEREHAVRELHDQVELNKIAAEIKPAETEVRDPFSHYDYQKFLRTFDRKLAVDVDGDEC
eukprot:254469_1